jgi:catechol 2,3-dioxygenase-like lactoylglutathione lyase family enzyme
MTEKAPESPAFTGIHHLKFPVSDLSASADWYGLAFGADRVATFDHRDENGRLFAVIVRFPAPASWPSCASRRTRPGPSRAMTR